MPYPTSYHNTTGVQGTLLDEFESKGKKQDQIVLDFFRQHPGSAFTPFDVLDGIKWEYKPPITSVRRSMTNLTNAGKLMKLRLEKEGYYGRPNKMWVLDIKYYPKE